MTTTKLRQPRRANMRRAVILFPSGLTLANLFFGVFAIITAARGDIRLAGIYVLWGGIFDALDGRVARATNAGSQFGEELDSLVDAISFGLAPAMIIYFAVLNHDGWDWIFVFLFAAAAVMRLARFNIEQAGTAKTYFQGLPSPAAGCTLASYYWFSQSWLNDYGNIGNLPWQEMLRFLMAALAALMISNVPYPAFPRTGFRSLRALAASLLVLGSIALLATKRLEYFFPLTLGYVAWGLLRWIFSGLFERRQPTIPYDLSEGEDDEEEEDFENGDSQVHANRQGHRDPRVTRDDRTRKPRPRADAAEPLPRTEDQPAHPERGERPGRPQRTDAEREARREKRDKREKREGQPARAPRPDRPASVAGAAGGTEGPVAAADAIAEGTDDEVVGFIPAATDAPIITASGEGAPARKRKRRRRRGERKERGPVDANDVGSPDDGPSDSADGGDGDGGGDDGPYSAADAPGAPPSTPFVPPMTEPHA